jgi:arginine repressor
LPLAKLVLPEHGARVGCRGYAAKEVVDGGRHNAIRELVANAPVTNQDELRRKLRRRGFAVTQATLSRDIHELRLSKGPGGYSLPNGNGAAAQRTRQPALGGGDD